MRAQLITGYANGAWNGPGINSAAAAANANHNTAIGYADATAIGITSTGSFLGGTVDNTSVLLRYTFAGDANLDGMVTSADFTRLSQNFSGSNKRWSDGDFNYDGKVNALDFNALATTYGLILPTPTPGDAIGAALPAGGLGALVPEPGSLGLLAAASAMLIRRRRRA